MVAQKGYDIVKYVGEELVYFHSIPQKFSVMSLKDQRLLTTEELHKAIAGIEKDQQKRRQSRGWRRRRGTYIDE